MSDKPALTHIPATTLTLSPTRASIFARARLDLSKDTQGTSAAAHFKLGVQHYNGNGVPQNFAQAAASFRRAAELGHAEAQYQLAILYDTGTGVPQSDELAAHFNSWPPRRTTPTPRLPSASITTPGRASRRTTPRPFAGATAPPTTTLPGPSTTSA